MRDHVQSHSFSPSDLIFFNPNLKGQKTFYWKGQSLILTFIPARWNLPRDSSSNQWKKKRIKNSNHCFCVYLMDFCPLKPHTARIHPRNQLGKSRGEKTDPHPVLKYTKGSDPKRPKDSRYPPNLSVFKITGGVLIPSHPEPQRLPPWPFQKEAQKNRIRTKTQSVVEGPFFYDNAFLPTSHRFFTRTY